MSIDAKYPENCTKVLNHGFVRLVDHMGDDTSIVQAARVSYGVGTKTTNDDAGLIRYLLRHKHTTPFEMVEFKFHMRMPIFVARQWIRHRTASVNEYSGRYSEMPELFYVPEASALKKQSQTNKQGGDDEIIEDTQASIDMFSKGQSKSYYEYEAHLQTGLSRELARINLPLSIYTEWYWKIDLHNLFHFLKLRLDTHAQYEIRVFAQAMADYIKPIVPIAWQAFEDYSLHAMHLSRLEIVALQCALSGQDFHFQNKREGDEFAKKMEIITGT